MKISEINTQISNLAGSINSDDQIRIQNSNGYQQPFIANQQRRGRHTAEIEKSVANGYVMLFVILFSLILGIIAIVILSYKQI
jgi:hypothetical protein